MLAKWHAGDALQILKRGMYISNADTLQHAELSHRGAAWFP